VAVGGWVARGHLHRARRGDAVSVLWRGTGRCWRPRRLHPGRGASQRECHGLLVWVPRPECTHRNAGSFVGHQRAAQSMATWSGVSGLDRRPRSITAATSERPRSQNPNWGPCSQRRIPQAPLRWIRRSMRKGKSATATALNHWGRHEQRALAFGWGSTPKLRVSFSSFAFLLHLRNGKPHEATRLRPRRCWGRASEGKPPRSLHSPTGPTRGVSYADEHGRAAIEAAFGGTVCPCRRSTAEVDGRRPPVRAQPNPVEGTHSGPSWRGRDHPTHRPQRQGIWRRALCTATGNLTHAVDDSAWTVDARDITR
jgi:hypothetical protein